LSPKAGGPTQGRLPMDADRCKADNRVPIRRPSKHKARLYLYFRSYSERLWPNRPYQEDLALLPLYRIHFCRWLAAAQAFQPQLRLLELHLLPQPDCKSLCSHASSRPRYERQYTHYWRRGGYSRRKLARAFDSAKLLCR